MASARDPPSVNCINSTSDSSGSGSAPCRAYWTRFRCAMRKAAVVVGEGGGDDGDILRGTCRRPGVFMAERGRGPGRRKRMSPFFFDGVDGRGDAWTDIEPSRWRGRARVNFMSAW